MLHFEYTLATNRNMPIFSFNLQKVPITAESPGVPPGVHLTHPFGLEVVPLDPDATEMTVRAFATEKQRDEAFETMIQVAGETH